MGNETTKGAAKLGGNRTGIQMSPVDIKKMLSDMDGDLGKPSPEGDESAISELRSAYISEADPVGSMPPPATLKGAVKSGAKMLTGSRPQVFMDKLGERLAFERSGTRLYDALITKCEASGGNTVSLAELKKFREDEARHFLLVGACIEAIGGDPTAQTPSADVAGVESAGLMQVVTDPKTSLAQSLHAILVAELTDNAAWDELVLLAREMGQDEFVERLSEAQEEERHHLETVREWHQKMTLAQANV
jgi:hypothetical protein